MEESYLQSWGEVWLLDWLHSISIRDVLFHILQLIFDLFLINDLCFLWNVELIFSPPHPNTPLSSPAWFPITVNLILFIASDMGGLGTIQCLSLFILGNTFADILRTLNSALIQ